jgi:signal transduction histidine kinase
MVGGTARCHRGFPREGKSGSGASRVTAAEALCDHGRITSSTQAGTVTGDPPPRPAGVPAFGLYRSRSSRVLTGVAGGLGERLGVDPAFVRAAFVVLALAGGAGVILYLALWAVTTDAPAAAPIVTRERTSSRTVGLGLVVVGSLLVLRDLGLWFGSTLVWSVGLAVVGSAVIWSHSDEAERARLARLAARIPGNPMEPLFAPRVATLVRVALGGLLVVIGLAFFVAGGETFERTGGVLLAMVVAVAGAALVFGPWVARLGRQVSDERRERIRSEERAEMAAHLHDSVLQTLALIQRSSEPREMAALARGQERELRAWLHGRLPGAGDDLLSTAFEELAALIEQRHHVKVEVVVVGDGPVDVRGGALVRAAGEAVANAAKHSGAPVVSVYVEGRPDGISAYVSDEGRGFDPAAVPGDRRGIADSIVGRMQRYGGTATVTSEPGEGTEVYLHVPRNGSS